MEKLNRLISQSISFWSFPNGYGASHLIFQQEFPYSPCKWHWNPRFCFYPSLRTEIVFQDIEKENQYSPKMFFFLNENILQRMIAPSVAQQSSFTWMHLYLSHFTCSDLGGLWLPSRKKDEASHPGNSFRYHVIFCGSHVVIFVLVWGSAELQISKDYSAENIDKHVFTAQNLILSSDKACPDDQYGQSESGVFHYYSPIRDWLRMLLGWTEITSKFFVVSLKIFRYKSVVILLKTRWQSFLNLSLFRLDDYSTCKMTLVWNILMMRMNW